MVGAGEWSLLLGLVALGASGRPSRSWRGRRVGVVGVTASRDSLRLVIEYVRCRPVRRSGGLRPSDRVAVWAPQLPPLGRPEVPPMQRS